MAFSKEIESAASLPTCGLAMVFTQNLFYAGPWELENQREEGEASPTLPKFPGTFPNYLGVITWTVRKALQPDRHRGGFWPVELNRGL